MTSSAAPVIELQQISTRFGSHSVHEGLDLSVRRGEILGLAAAHEATRRVLAALASFCADQPGR